VTLALLIGGPLQAAERVHVRVATHGDVTRLVFDWGTDVDYKAQLSEAFLEVDFARPGIFDIQDLRERLPERLAEAEVTADDHGLKLRFRRPQKIVHFTLPGRVVFDLENAAHGIQTLAAMEDLKESASAARTARRDWVPAVPRRRPNGLGGGTEGPRFATWPLEDAAAGGPRAAPARVEVLPLEVSLGDKLSPITASVADEEGFALSLAWERLPAAAAFRFADHIWLLFDAPLPVGTAAAIERTTGRKGVTQRPSGAGTLLKIAAGPALAPRLSREGNVWHVDLRPRMPLPALAVSRARIAGTDADATLRYALPEAGPIHWLEEPDSGERLIVVPSLAAGQGLAMDSRQPQFAALQSQQGLALRPFDESLGVAVSGDAVNVIHEKGLLASPHSVAGPAAVRLEAQGRLFDLAAWRQGAAEDFAGVKQRLLAAVLAAPKGRSDDARLTLARFFFAWGLFNEADAQLDLLAGDADEGTSGPEMPLMRAIAALHREDLSQAAALLGDPRLADFREAVLWQAAFAAITHDWEAAAAGFAVSDNLIGGYPPRVGNRLLRLAASARLGIGDSGGASQYLVAHGRAPQTRAERAEATFLTAERYLLDGERVRAQALWADLRDSDHPEIRAKARRALLEADYAAGRLDLAGLLAGLERLRFAWRGDAFELDVLLRLSDLYAEAGHYRESLEMLRQAASYFPDEARAWQVAGRMRQIFQVVFLASEAPKVPPLTALALYEEFEELTPSGVEGDLILRRLADRLVEMDLLDRAAELLEDLLRYRATGGARAVVGARLAEIYLLNDDPAAALHSLDNSEAAQVSPERLAERRLLRARALSGLTRFADALAGLGGDESPAALQLRGEIYGRMEKWPEALAVYARLLPEIAPQRARGGPPLATRDAKAAPLAALTPDAAALVMKAAVAASLADDPASLARLYRAYGRAMAAQPQSAAFTFLAGGLDADGGEDPTQSLAIAGEAKNLLLD